MTNAAGGPAGRANLERAVFQSQLPLAAAALLLICVEFVVQPSVVANPLFVAGATGIFVVTALAAVVPWGLLKRPWVAVLPAADMLAVTVLGHGSTDLTTGVLLAFPVIWLSTYFGFAGTIASAGASAALIWVAAALGGSVHDETAVPGLIVLPVTLTFIATVTYLRSKRSAAQLGLVRQQATLLEGAHHRARRQEQTLDAVLNSVDFGVVAFDSQGRETLANSTYRLLITQFGRPVGSGGALPTLYGPDRKTLVPEEERPYRQAVLGRAFDDVIVWVGEPGGRRKALSVSARQIVGPHGQNDGGIMVTRDVTREINAIQARDDLVASVSHELRTPLTFILGYLELALDDETIAPKTRAMLTVASTNSDRLLALIADLFTATSASDHSLLMSFTGCDMTEIVGDSIKAQQLLAEQRGITLELVTHAPHLLVADGFRLRQVIDNLLTNSIKYNKENGDVTVAVTATSTDVIVTVTDTGIGLSDEEQTQLFERYFRAESVRKSSIHGSGLGLSITRDIVRQHGGDLTVTSELGVGSKFTVRVPVEHLELA
ncbi:sensor histidine kinase [Subtercola vilae]|uniref:histidine kinase n=1 Tax=Subtercola vilae TaxID=2056433 RepID=A0A4T2BEK4_9MICO|nr:PAS domain-containing sensor histidine kinase [Subtercola vilae]TIH29655.1 PAS domain-containing sensor histidine kinase [Subtercola vilae]